jgi:hypothetical protein
VSEVNTERERKQLTRGERILERIKRFSKTKTHDTLAGCFLARE